MTDMTGRYRSPYANLLHDPETLRLATIDRRREHGIMDWRIARGIGATIDGVHTDRRPRIRAF